MASLGNIPFACESPGLLARFWAEALGYAVQEAPPGFMEAWLATGGDPDGAAAIVDPEGRGPRLFFEKKSKTPTTVIPIHLDLKAPDREAEVERLVGLGACVVETRTRETGDPIPENWTSYDESPNVHHGRKEGSRKPWARDTHRSRSSKSCARDTRLTLSALEMALVTRRTAVGLIHHSDQGVQYASSEYVLRLEEAGALISMASVGNPYERTLRPRAFSGL